MNPFELLKNSAKIQEEAQKMKEELERTTAEGSAGGRMVVININGKMEITDIHLDPICVDNRDVKMLEDLIMAAHHSAIENIQEQIKAKSGALLQGLNIPGLGL